MAIMISIDNNRSLAGIQALLADETAGVQTLATTDDGNEIDVTLASGSLSGFQTAFNTFLNGLGLSTAQKEYARDHDGASSATNFVLVTTSAGETINDLFFADGTGAALDGDQVVGMKTLDGQNVYLWTNGNFGSSGDFCVATTSPTAGQGEIVAVFYLNENTTDHKSAQVQMVTFEPLEHNLNGLNPDDALNFTDVLRVAASGSLSFDFDALKSGECLWAAVGSASGGVLVTGESLDVDGDGKKTNASDKVHVSQGGDGTTIGLNNQLFDNAGETAVFTLVTGLDVLTTADDGAQDDYLIDHQGPNADGIDYSGYLNVTGAGIFISQSQGNDKKDFDVSLWRAGGINGTVVEDGLDYLGTEPSGAFDNDIAVNVGTVTVKNELGQTVGVWSIAPSGTQLASGATVAGVQVTISGNNIDLNGLDDLYTVSWTSAGGATFNRFQLTSEAGQFDVGRIDVTQTVPGSTAVGDQLFVEDDGPALSGQSVSKQVDEDELSVAAANGDQSTGVTDSDSDTDEVTYSNADLQAVLSAGTDAPATFSLNLTVSGAVKDVDGNAMTSKGAAITWSVSGSVVQAVADGRIVFTITQTAGTGTPNDPTDDVFTVDLRDQIDHPSASGDNGTETLDLTPAFLARDDDNDPADLNGAANDQETIRLVIENDVPVLSGEIASKRVEEDELSTTAPAPADLSNGVTDGDLFTDEAVFTYADLSGLVTMGADELVSFDLSESVSGAVRDILGNAVTSKGAAINYSVVAGVIQGVADGRIVFTIAQTAGAGTPDDPTDDEFTVDLRDQIDHAAASGDDGTTTLNLTPAFTARDFDGDQVDMNGTGDDAMPIRLVVENDVPTLSGASVSKRVEEDELSVAANDGDQSTGITDGDGDTDEVTYSNADLQATVNAGADEPVSFDLNLSVAGAVKDIDGNAMTSKGAAITWNVNGSVIEAVAGGRIVFTISQTAGGATADPTDDVFRVDLRDQIDHPNASGDAGIETLDLTPAFTAADYDGDAVDLNGAADDQETIRLVVENDVPAVSGTISKRVEEDELAVAAADGDLSTGITDGDGDTDEVTFTNAELQGAITTGADEPVSFDLNASVSGAVKDIDGNAMTSKGAAISWSYNVGTGAIEAVAGGRVIFTIAQTAGALTTDDPTDDVFTVDLRDQLDHPNAAGDLGIETLDLTPAFTAADHDGDAVDLNGAGNDQEAIQLVVENDVPALSGASVSKRVEEDELSVAAADGDGSTGISDLDLSTDEVDYSNADLQAAVTPGADEPVSFDLNLTVSGAVKDVDGNTMTSKGEAMSWTVVGGVVQAVAGGRIVFTVSQTAGAATATDPTDDVFRVDLRDQIDHPDGSGDGGIETLDLTPAFTAVDFDGDAVDLNGAGNDQETIQLVVENDVPAITAQILGGAVDFIVNDSVTSSLNGAIGGDDNNATSQTAGGVKQYTISSFSEPKNVFADLDGVLSADGTKVTYYSTSVTANQNASTAIYELALNQTANSGAGSYTFTVLQPPPQQVVNLDFTDLPSGQNFHGTIAIDKTDLTDGGLLVFASNADINDLEGGNPAESNDGTMTSDSGTVNTSKGGGPVTIGNGNQAFENNAEGCWFVYVDNPAAASVAGVGLDQNNADDADTIAFNGTIEIRKASVEIVQASGKGTLQSPGPGMQIKAYDLDPQTVGAPGGAGVETGSRDFVLDPAATGDQVSIIGAKIYNANGVLIEYRTNPGGAGNNFGTLMDSGDAGTGVSAADDSLVGIEFVQDSAGIFSIKVTNLAQNYTIEWETGVDHDAALTQHLAGSYDIGGFNLLQGQDTPDQLFNFSVQIADYDGDEDGGVGDAFANFGVTIDGTGVNNDPLVG